MNRLTPVDRRQSSEPVRYGFLSILSWDAEFLAGTTAPPNGVDPAPWFRNIPLGASFDLGRQSLDYSFQIAVGLRVCPGISCFFGARCGSCRQAYA